MSHTKYTFWLMPAELLKSRLQAVIRDLAQEFNAPDFDPHVTLYGGESSVEEASAIAEEIAAAFSPLELEAESLKQSEQYTKTFFVQFRASDVARQISDMARDNATVPAPYVLNPHLSLLYQNVTEEQREELCRRPIIPTGVWRFDAIRVIEGISPSTEQSIKKWRTVAEYGLREGFRRRRDDLK